MEKLTILFFLALLSMGCESMITGGHNQQPYDKIAPKTAFNDEDGLKLYINSLYNNLPGGNGIAHNDQISDYLARKTVPTYLKPGAYGPKEAGGWSWGGLRNINYFLNNAPEQARGEVRDEVLNHYIGVARFFRALYYFKKVKRYGDVPWYNTALDPADSTELYKSQDPRTLVMDSVRADLNYAINNLNDTKNSTASRITKWVALAYKSRICLFEGTYRKYHEELNLKGTAAQWLKEAVTSAEEVMNSGEYSLHESSSNPELSYRELFIDQGGHSPADETILAYNASREQNILHDANWYYTSPTYGSRLNFTKPFINTYLTIDGTPFTDISGYKKMPFMEEVKDRDLRLQQTIRMKGYKRTDGTTPAPNFSYSMTGYQPIKFTLASKQYDNEIVNDNSIPLIRFAEVLLNFAEAKAELGTFNQNDWNKSIKLLRERAGIINTSVPAKMDEYMRETYFPNITDPVLLEIRRERGIELALEGFRFDDLRRWKRGELLEMPYKGMYVPKTNTLYDLNSDGKSDVSFVNEIPDSKESGVVYVELKEGDYELTDGDKGNILWRDNLDKEWEDYKYIYPIPFDAISLNPNLKQNKGWGDK